MVKIIHYLVLGVLALGAVYYVWTKPPTINPMIDRRVPTRLRWFRRTGHWAIRRFCKP